MWRLKLKLVKVDDCPKRRAALKRSSDLFRFAKFAATGFPHRAIRGLFFSGLRMLLWQI
jgi:hypothetical protein